MVSASSSAWRLALAGVAVGLALGAQRLTFESFSSSTGWLLFAASVALVVIAVPSPAVAIAATASAMAPRPPLPVVAAGLPVLAVTLTTMLSSRNRFPVLAVGLWVPGCVLGAADLHGRLASVPT